ncbi:Asp-tRNA(Asn)/Glu-tRNA(Gln) amidotransferase subunit GatB [Candidatus Saccharibacteria bacterium]|nr:Asp-tRNA(Asn)/Glu-tRNA(Gln) amidotransferase subunit GatB [Candidatus Saccharibacteria bacterium]
MASPKKLSDHYIPTIGIECHVQLKTKTKLFSAVGNDARQASPNTLISHIDLGMPGALPVLNEQAVYLAVKAAFALGTAPQKFSKFDRKHYFYPDLPKGYQITQYDQPIITGGHVNIMVDGWTKRVNLTRAHLEEDSGKSTHPVGKDYSLVDLNRAGTPLLEIVSEPDMHSPAEAKAYSRELYLLMRYAGVSDANLYYGNMRFDVNVSVSKDPNKLGIRSETKNLNSFRSVEKAVEYEVKRQIQLLGKGHPVVQETRGWDEAKQKTFSQRSKEDAHDYRYFPEPDIPPLELDARFIEKIRRAMPGMPSALRTKFKRLGIDNSGVEVLIGNPENARFIEKILNKHGPEHARRIANWSINSYEVLITDQSDQGLDEVISDTSAVRLSVMVATQEVSSTAAKHIWLEMVTEGGDPVKLAKSKDLLQVSNEAKISRIVGEVLKSNPQAVEDVKKGQTKATGFLVGQVMKASGGKANPGLTQKLIKQQLNL